MRARNSFKTPVFYVLFAGESLTSKSQQDGGKSKKTQEWVVSSSKQEELIPKVLDKYLPFQAEPLNKWNDDTDLLQFLYTLYDNPAVILSEDGTRTYSNYREYGKYVYEEGRASIHNWISKFNEAAEKSIPAPGSATQTIEIPDLSADSLFGRAAKHIIAFDGIIRHIMEEGSFYSIAHIMEAETDLQCSILLAANLFYKHSMQVLRSMLENLVLPIHFANNESDFKAWRKDSFRTPRLRGENGLLSKLVDIDKLSKNTANNISKLYSELNQYIHSAEGSLVHKGFHSGKWTGHIFKESDFYHWCTFLTDVLVLAINLLRTHINEWQRSFATKGLLCTICLSSDFDVTKKEFAGELYFNYHCRRCGYTMLKSGGKVE